MSDKFKELINDYHDLLDSVPGDQSEEKDKAVMKYACAAAIRIWSVNYLYSPDYQTALKSVTGKDYTVEQIITALSCCGEKSKRLAVPGFFKQIVERDLECGCITADHFLNVLSSFLGAMALINGDFTVEEANMLQEIMDSLIGYAKSCGLSVGSDYQVPKTTEPAASGYLANDVLLKKSTDKSPKETEKDPSPKNDSDTHGLIVPIIPVIINVGRENSEVLNKAEEEKPVEPEVKPSINSNTDDKETLESLLKELDELIGLDNIKRDVHSLINFIRISRMRKERGMKVPTISYHLVFTGNPGTGKTTVARLIARLYYQMGILPKGQLVEADRSTLVAGYLGQTAIKTQKVIQEAMGGVLFIDEAYSLSDEGGDSYGKEAIETILKAMEDHRDELIVIVAGYTDLMHDFIDSNPGLSSRFGKYFEFSDYSEDELTSIFKSFCEKNGYNLSADAELILKKHFLDLYENRDKKFGNARTARNVFEKSIHAQANRLAEMVSLTDCDLESITADDINSAINGIF